MNFWISNQIQNSVDFTGQTIEKALQTGELNFCEGCVLNATAPQ